MTPEEAFEAAAEIVGGKSSLAREVGVTTSAVNQWKKVPARKVLLVEAAVARALARPPITRYDLRPDFYPRET